MTESIQLAPGETWTVEQSGEGYTIRDTYGNIRGQYGTPDALAAHLAMSLYRQWRYENMLRRITESHVAPNEIELQQRGWDRRGSYWIDPDNRNGEQVSLVKAWEIERDKDLKMAQGILQHREDELDVEAGHEAMKEPEAVSWETLRNES